MAEKAKFDREAAFKSIIGAGRQSENILLHDFAKLAFCSSLLSISME